MKIFNWFKNKKAPPTLQELKSWLTINNEIIDPTNREGIVVKFNNKYYRIKELG